MSKIMIFAKEFSSGMIHDYNILVKHVPFRCVQFEGNSKQKAKAVKTVYIKILLEHIDPIWLTIPSQYTYYMPNHEQLTEWDVKYLPTMDKILCKNQYTYNMMPPKNRVLTKFTSACSTSTAHKDYTLVVHFGGTSYMKGTLQLLRAWVSNKGFTHVNKDIKLLFTCNPRFNKNIVQYWRSLKPTKCSTCIGRTTACEKFNNMYYVEHLPVNDFNYFSAKAGIRIQPSIMEGYGHVINEGRCNHTLTMTTDAPPMNELITDKKCLIRVKHTKPSYEIFKPFAAKYKYMHRGKSKAHYIDPSDFKTKMENIITMSLSEKNKIVNAQFKQYEKDTAEFGAAINKLFNTVGGRPPMKRTINVITVSKELRVACDAMLDHGFNIRHYDKYPSCNIPSFITITDVMPLAELPSSYIIMYAKTVPRCIHPRTTFVNQLSGIGKLCAALHKGATERKVKNMTMYNVGEHVFTGKKVNNPFNYDDSYDLWVDDRDTLVKQSAKKGVPYEKYMTACLSAFIEPGATVLDIGANVGTVSLPLSRLHGGNVHVVSFEPFPNTYSILFKNVTQNNAFNVVPLKMAVGDRNRKEISLSDNLVIPPDFKDKKGKSTTIDLKKDNDTIHFGAIHVGVGETKTSMATVDELKLNISAMKVDVEGAEPLVFYGAKKTIKRCMPVIVFEHNENIVSDEMKKALNLTAAVATFDILQYCYSLGYRLIYELHIQDYMLVPPGRKQLVLNSIAKFKKVKNIKTFNPALINKFSLYKFITPRW